MTKMWSPVWSILHFGVLTTCVQCSARVWTEHPCWRAVCVYCEHCVFVKFVKFNYVPKISSVDRLSLNTAHQRSQRSRAVPNKHRRVIFLPTPVFKWQIIYCDTLALQLAAAVVLSCRYWGIWMISFAMLSAVEISNAFSGQKLLNCQSFTCKGSGSSLVIYGLCLSLKNPCPIQHLDRFSSFGLDFRVSHTAWGSLCVYMCVYVWVQRGQQQQLLLRRRLV